MKKIYFLLAIALLSLASCKKDDETTQPVVSDYDKADAVKGGILYDKFWATEANYDVSDAAKISHLNRYADFYRCKQCHAWDLMGTEGSYNSRGPRASTTTAAGRPNIANSLVQSRAKSAQQLFDNIKSGTNRRSISDSIGVTEYNPTTNSSVGDKMPNYGALLTDAQIWDLVKFLKEGAIDVTTLYDGTYTGTYPTGKASYSNLGKDGNASSGKTFYSSNCASCHGTTGTSILMESMTVGKFTRSKAYEVQHKVKFGQLGSSMKATKVTNTEMKDLYKALADTVAFPN